MAVVGAAFAAISSAVSAFAASSVFAGALVKLAGSLVLSALARALAPKPEQPRQPGIKTSITTQGGVNPQSFILGRYATAGNEVAPPYTHGVGNQAPNANLTYIHDLGDMPGANLLRLIINDDYVTIGSGTHATFGNEIEGKYQDRAWIKFYDGTQTTADSYLNGRYGSAAKRPWDTDMIGRGIPYAILTFRFKRKLYNALPRVRYELEGIALYDPRKDTTVGGSGSHRWDTPSTWEFTENPAVMIYNILRGITLPDGSVWGGECEAADLPVANWFAAMNVCDEDVDLSAGGTQKRYRAGYEVQVDQPPADVIDELLKACAGQIAEFGGVYKMLAGGVASPVYFMTDEDIVVSKDQTFKPFPALEETYNAVHASYPEPASKWAPKDAPPRYNSTLETEDQGRRLVADLTLPAVHNGLQVQRLMKGYIEEERRFRRHIFALPPDAAILEPLDSISWTSAANGYTTKVFEVVSLVDQLATLIQTVALRERDSADYNWSTGDEVAFTTAEPGIEEPPAQDVADWTVAATAIEDGSAANRRPAILMTWSGSEVDEVSGLRYEIYAAATDVLVAQGVTTDVAAGSFIHSEGILPNVEYKARGIYEAASGRDFNWTSYDSDTTGDLTFERPDLKEGSVSDIVTFIDFGPFGFPSSGNPQTIFIFTRSVGAIDVTDAFVLGLHFEFRRPGGGAGPDGLVELQREYTTVGAGSPDSWVTIQSWSTPNSSFVERTFSDTLVGYKDEVRYRLIATSGGTSPQGWGSFDYVRRVRFSIRAVKR